MKGKIFIKKKIVVFEIFDPLIKTTIIQQGRRCHYPCIPILSRIRTPLWRQQFLEFANWKTIKAAFQLDLLTNFKAHVTKYFSHPRILKILEFPVLFLGATPEKTPALYSLMNHADIKLGTWYPMGGMNQIVKGMYNLALSLGVEFKFNEEVSSIEVDSKGSVSGIQTKTNFYSADIVVVNADYAHADQKLLAPQWRSYSAQ